LIALGVVLTPLLLVVIGVFIHLDLFDFVLVASVLFFIICGLAVFSIHSVPLFILYKKRLHQTIKKYQARLLLSTAIGLFVLTLIFVSVTHIGPLLFNWPVCPISSGVCWIGLPVPLAVHYLLFFGLGVIGIITLPYLIFLLLYAWDARQKKSRTTTPSA
jgi:hypothetical protein